MERKIESWGIANVDFEALEISWAMKRWGIGPGIPRINLSEVLKPCIGENIGFQIWEMKKSYIIIAMLLEMQ